MNTSMVTTIAAAVLIALGGFLIWRYGQAMHTNGYDACVMDMQKLIAKTAQQLEDQRNEVIPDSDVIIRLRVNNWLRPDGDV